LGDAQLVNLKLSSEKFTAQATAEADGVATMSSLVESQVIPTEVGDLNLWVYD
jgi:hypothetical protein